MTLQCLQKIAANFPLEIIVVDNHSTDNVVPFNQSFFPNIRFIQNDKNLGFSRANNLGVQYASADQLLILNPDTIISEAVIKSALNLLNDSPKTAAVGVKMLDGNGEYLPESVRRFPNLSSSFMKLLGLNRWTKYYGEPQNGATIEVMAGACIFIKKNVFEAIGGFDERYFMYGEDIDLSYQLNKNGYEAAYLSSEEIIHFKGRSSVKSNWKYQEAFYNAMKLYWQKNLMQNFSAAFTPVLSLLLWGLKILSFAKHLIKQLLFPILDFAGICLATLLFSHFWYEVDKPFCNKFNFFVIPLYALIIVLANALAKLYISHCDLQRLFKAVPLQWILILLTYFILPTEFKFSRAVIFYLAIVAFFVPFLIRLIYAKFKNKNLSFSDTQNILGEIIPDELSNMKLKNIFKNYANIDFISVTDKATAIVLEIEKLSNEAIIKHIKTPRDNRQLWLYSAQGNYAILSQGKDDSSYILAADTAYQIDRWINRVLKRGFDIVAALFIVPLGVFAKPNYQFILRSAWNVLFRNYTWVYPQNHRGIKPVFTLSEELAPNYYRYYSLRNDCYYFFRAMFIS